MVLPDSSSLTSSLTPSRSHQLQDSCFLVRCLRGVHRVQCFLSNSPFIGPLCKDGCCPMGRVVSQCVSTSAFAFLLPQHTFRPCHTHTAHTHTPSLQSNQNPTHYRGFGLQLLSCGPVAVCLWCPPFSGLRDLPEE